MVPPLALLVATALMRACPPMDPARVVAAGPNEWELRPSTGIQCRYAGLELWFTHLPSPAPTVVVGETSLPLQADSLAGRIAGVLTEALPPVPLVVRSETRPVGAALIVADPAPDPPEPTPTNPGVVWDLSIDAAEESWRVHDGAGAVGAPVGERWLNGRCTISTGRHWQGLEASRHPVVIIQYRALTGRGEGALAWRTAEGDTGSARWRFASLGLWRQVHIPLHRDAAWRGTVDSMAIVPLDHHAPVQMGWVFAPRLAAAWAALLEMPSARWAAVLVVITAVAGMVKAFFRLEVRRPWVVALSAMAMLAPVVLPFQELCAGFWLGRVFVPWYLATLALLAVGLAPGPPSLVAASWACVGVTVLLGLAVAEGAGLQTALTLTAGPLAFLVGRGLGRHRLGRSTSIVMATFVGAAAVHAFFCHTPADDPLYGSLLATLGRSYWDETVAGRTAGMFVHPLVFALVVLVAGTGMLAQPPPASRQRWAGLVLLVAGLRAVSRAYLGILSVLFVLRWQHRVDWRLRVAVCGALLVAVACVFSSRDQGLLRGVQVRRRVEGVKVTVKALRHKPLQGFGWGRYRTALRRHGSVLARSVPFSTPDNTYLRLLTEGGLVGGGMWVVWLAAVVSAAVRCPPASPLPLWAPAVGMALMWAVFDAAYWPGAVTVPMGLLGVWTRERRQ